jgi:hypothetical protein
VWLSDTSQLGELRVSLGQEKVEIHSPPKKVHSPQNCPWPNEEVKGHVYDSNLGTQRVWSQGRPRHYEEILQ